MEHKIEITNKFHQRKMIMTLKDQKNIMERVGIFLDVQNLYMVTHKIFPNYHVDYRILLDKILGYKPYNGIPRKIVDAIAYTVCVEGHSQADFVKVLEKCNIKVKEKIRKEHMDGYTHYYSRADWDIGMAVDIIDKKEKYDTVVIATNDGDFIPVITKLKEYGIRVEIMAFEKMFNRYLKGVSDKIYFIRKNHLLMYRGEKKDA